MLTSPIRSNRFNSEPSLLEKSTIEEDTINISSDKSSKSRSNTNSDEEMQGRGGGESIVFRCPNSKLIYIYI